MLDIIIDKTRCLVEDFGETTIDSFSYTTSNIFTLTEDKKITILSVLINGNVLGSAESYDFDEDTSQITIDASLSSTDVITVKYNFYHWSDTEITNFIKAALVWISLKSVCSTIDFEIEEDYIHPTPTNKEMDLIALIASILIKPNFVEKRLPNLLERYPRSKSKEDIIQALIVDFYRGTGILDVLTFD